MDILIPVGAVLILPVYFGLVWIWWKLNGSSDDVYLEV